MCNTSRRQQQASQPRQETAASGSVATPFVIFQVWIACHADVGGLSAVLVVLTGKTLAVPFFLEGNTKNAIAKAPPVQRVEGSASVLFVQMHKTKALTAPRHYVRSQVNRSDITKLREQLIQTFLGRTRGQIFHHHFRHHYPFCLIRATAHQLYTGMTTPFHFVTPFHFYLKKGPGYILHNIRQIQQYSKMYQDP
jgi:hypothetical protein